jgi:glycosyltransferase involved in cell wall biosynthesis
MKILQLIDVPWDSGLAHYALVLSQELKHSGHQVFISALPGQKPWAKARRLGLKTVPLATFKGLPSLRRFIATHQIDILNAHTGKTHSLAVASSLGKRVAVVRTRSDAREISRKFGNGFIYQHTDRIIAAADYIRDAFVKTLRLPTRKVVTIYQGIASEEFKLQAFPKLPTLGIVARLDPVKGHRYLLEAISLLRQAHPQLKLKIVGQEENVKQRELATIIHRLRLSAHVEFLGYQKSVAEIMASCSIGVIASTGSEAVSRVALEWMAAGRPIVATQVGCLPEVVQKNKTGILVEPKSGTALARGIASLLNERERIGAMGAAARARVESLFSMRRFAEETLDVYRAALKDSGCLN